MILIESFFQTTHNGFQSAGTVEDEASALVAFYQARDGHLVVSSVRQDGDTVEVHRAILLSGVVTEKTLCVCPSVEEAARLAAALEPLVESVPA